MKKLIDTLLPDLKYNDCPCAGRNLDKLVQPAILTVLAHESLHGYVLVQRLADMPMFGGQKPDATGVYRFLRQMEERALVTSTWDTSEIGPAKRLYIITKSGLSCLCRWKNTLSTYYNALGELLTQIPSGLSE
ncbi:MAG: helix-turn-helix transcriptional regulator [bacterium]